MYMYVWTFLSYFNTSHIITNNEPSVTYIKMSSPEKEKYLKSAILIVYDVLQNFSLLLKHSQILLEYMRVSMY